jgi:membrane-bound lytic murein transglycosylase MltF
MNIKKNKLLTIIKNELENTKHLKNIKNIEYKILNQAVKESFLKVDAMRYEKHLDDYSIGIFQLLTKTAKWLGNEDGEDLTDPQISAKYAIKYLDFLYSKFREIKDKRERIKMAFASYNCGRGNINKALKRGREIEEISFEGINTEQGAWSTYANVAKVLKKYEILSDTNCDINENYINFIFMKS